MQTTRFSPGKYIWGMVASLIILLVGGWLILAPFALGYQPYGASWDSQTTNDFVTGIPVAVVALVSFSFFFLSMLGALRAAGILAARQSPQVPVAAPAPVAMPPAQASQQSELDQTLATLAAALAADLTSRRQAGSNQGNQQLDQPVDRADQMTTRRDV